MDKWYSWIVKNRNPIVTVFKGLYFLLLVVLFFGYRAIVLEQGSAVFYYSLGRTVGQAGIIFFIFASIPGIMRRFGRFSKPVSVLMIFRRYIGIAMYMFAILHFCFVRFFWTLSQKIPVVSGALFEWAGLIAFILLFSLFVTSNDWSVSKLGIWWDRIHDLMYIIVWLLFAHVMLQGFSIWGVLIGLTSVAQILSHIYTRGFRART